MKTNYEGCTKESKLKQTLRYGYNMKKCLDMINPVKPQDTKLHRI